MYEQIGININLEKKAEKVEKNLVETFAKIDENTQYNSTKVLLAFQKNEISDMHFGTSTGYGEGDVRKGCNRKNICRNIGRRR